MSVFVISRQTFWTFFLLSGLAVAADYELGQKMIRDRSFEQNAEYFANVFEIGRRHKILNPECMRTGPAHLQI